MQQKNSTTNKISGCGLKSCERRVWVILQIVRQNKHFYHDWVEVDYLMWNNEKNNNINLAIWFLYHKMKTSALIFIINLRDTVNERLCEIVAAWKGFSENVTL